MIYLGNNKIGSIYSGENKIDKIYKGEELIHSSGLPKGTVFNFGYTGSAQQIELPSGRYLLEVWGAQGGGSVWYSGNGGYSKGIINIRKGVFLNCYVGNVRYNGGGYSSDFGDSGGGGTDIRINSDSLYSRVIVAGGGGGEGYRSSPGGEGGGVSGGVGTGASYTTYGGSQTGGSAFGIGGDSGRGGGGGGGWYGGYGSTDGPGGGGGSGYIHTPDSHKPKGWLLTEEHYLTEAETIAGNKRIPKPSGGTQTGHTGSGYARITVI